MPLYRSPMYTDRRYHGPKYVLYMYMSIPGVFQIPRSLDRVFDLGEHEFVCIHTDDHIHVLVSLQLKQVHQLYVGLVLQEPVDEGLADDERVNCSDMTDRGGKDRGNHGVVLVGSKMQPRNTKLCI